MHTPPWPVFIDAMRRRGIAFEAGLSAAEFNATEAAHGFEFPAELIEFLRLAMPVGPEFPNWRQTTPALLKQIDWPLDGLLFDWEHNHLWLEKWGPRPVEKAAAADQLGTLLARAPRLIPLYGHRYLAAVHPGAGNMILSVYQSDIIRFAPTLAHWLNSEFKLDLELPPAPTAITPLPFWDDLID